MHTHIQTQIIDSASPGEPGPAVMPASAVDRTTGCAVDLAKKTISEDFIESERPVIRNKQVSYPLSSGFSV